MLRPNDLQECDRNSSVVCRSTLFALAAIALAGCASISKQECQAIDWRTVGFEDGACASTDAGAWTANR